MGKRERGCLRDRETKGRAGQRKGMAKTPVVEEDAEGEKRQLGLREKV